MMTLQSKDKAALNVSPLLTLRLGTDSRKPRNVERLEFALVEMPGMGSVTTGPTGQDQESELSEEETPSSESAQSSSERLVEELDAAFERGRVQGRDDAKVDSEQQLAEAQFQIRKCCADFQRARDGYFNSIEEQVVKLALEIAKRVLHREIRVDPMALQGVVGAALTKVVDESGTILRVPIEETESWNELFREHEAFAVEVRGETRLAAGECILETKVGRVELGITAQMEEIEKGFFDLTHQRSV